MNQKDQQCTIQNMDDEIPENYLFFSSIELIEFFLNNLIDKDIKTQTKRIFEMARIFMNKKGFELGNIYSILVMVRDINHRSIVNEVFELYFKEGCYPIRVFVQISDLEDSADLEMEFSAFRGEKHFINTNQGHVPTDPFSQGVMIEDFVHCSGVLPLEPATQALVRGDFRQQVSQCMDHLRIVLEAAGTTLDKAYSFMVYLKNIDLLSQIEEVFEGYFSEREDIVQDVTVVDGLMDDHEIEISCSAYLR